MRSYSPRTSSAAPDAHVPCQSPSETASVSFVASAGPLSAAPATVCSFQPASLSPHPAAHAPPGPPCAAAGTAVGLDAAAVKTIPDSAAANLCFRPFRRYVLGRHQCRFVKQCCPTSRLNCNQNHIWIRIQNHNPVRRNLKSCTPGIPPRRGLRAPSPGFLTKTQKCPQCRNNYSKLRCACHSARCPASNHWCTVPNRCRKQSYSRSRTIYHAEIHFPYFY